MIKRLAEKTSAYYSGKGIIDFDKQAIYSYGFELLISAILNISGIIISLFCESALCAVLFMIAFVPLRLSAGGYHAKHHISCILGFNAIFLGFAIFLKQFDHNMLAVYSLVSVLVSFILTWIFSPVGAINKPLGNEQRQEQRKISLIISSINLAVALLYFVIPFLPIVLLSYYASGTLCAGALLLAAKIFNMNRPHN